MRRERAEIGKSSIYCSHCQNVGNALERKVGEQLLMREGWKGRKLRGWGALKWTLANYLALLIDLTEHISGRLLKLSCIAHYKLYVIHVHVVY